MKLNLCLIITLLSAAVSVARPRPVPNQNSQHISEPGVHRPSSPPCNASQRDSWCLGYHATNGTHVLPGEITGCGSADLGLWMPFDYNVDVPDNEADYYDRHVVQTNLQRVFPDSKNSHDVYRSLEAILHTDELCNDTGKAILVKGGEAVSVYGKGNGTVFKSLFIFSDYIA